jgi:imidazolonepropionase-like amidohydrolase
MFKYLVAAATLLVSTAHAETYAIQAGRLIVDAAQPARGPSTVIVENGRIARIEDGATAPAGTIVQQLQRGYKLGDRLLRPALVVVAKPKSTE